MSAETITTAIFLITAVVATAVLVNAIYPVIYSTAGTFQTSTHDADMRLRTDFKIVANFAKVSDNTADVYMKNIGSQRISLTEISQSNVFCGTNVGNLLTYSSKNPPTDFNTWNAVIIPVPNDTTDSNYWDTGETLHIKVYTNGPNSIGLGGTVYFQFILPNGIWRSTEFSAS